MWPQNIPGAPVAPASRRPSVFGSHGQWLSVRRFFHRRDKASGSAENSAASRHPLRRFAAVLAALLLLLPPPIGAYHKRLTQEEVSEAYYLGQRHDAQLGAFFDLYQRNLPGPSGPGDYISAVVIRTPYALAVLRSAAAIGHYTAQQAWDDYRAAFDRFEIIAYLDYSFGNKSAPETQPPVARDAVRGYYVQVKQIRDNEERTVVARDAKLQRGIDTGTLPVSLQIHATFRVQDIDSSDLTVEVTIPSGRRVVVTYNLEELR